MNLHVQNCQRRVRPNLSRVARLARFFADCVRRGGASGWRTLSVVLTDDAGIAATNRIYLDHDGATDVISFALPPLPGAALGEGEVHLNLQRALEEGRARGDVPGEVALYLAHGIAHLAGGTDATGPERRAMRRTERDWLGRARRMGLLADLAAERVRRSRP